MTDLTLPYGLVYLLLFVSGIGTYIAGLFVGNLLLKVYLFVSAFLTEFKKK